MIVRPEDTLLHQNSHALQHLINRHGKWKRVGSHRIPIQHEMIIELHSIQRVLLLSQVVGLFVAFLCHFST